MLKKMLPLVAVLAIPISAHAFEDKLPKTLTFTAYDTGTSGFNIAVAVSKALKDRYNIEARVIPAGNDVARFAPLRTNRAQMVASGIGAYFAQEGMFEFSTRDWGPQAFQTVLATIDCNGVSLGAAKDSGIREPKDLRGKRVGFVVGAPSLNYSALSIMAFGGLTKNDVKIVEFASNGAMWKGIITNDIDAAFTTTTTGPAREVDASPRGLVWLPLPHADKAGWERMRKVSSHFVPHVATCGAAVTTPIEMATYPYPAFITQGATPVDEVHAVTKAMITAYDAIKDGAPGAGGLKADRQLRQWVIPFHEGAAKALREAGAWSEADEIYNAALRKRQTLLRETWNAYVATNPPDDKDKFRDGWLVARRAALAKAGLPNGLEE